MNDYEEEVLSKYRGLYDDLKKWAKYVDDKLYNEILAEFKRSYRIKIPPKYRIKDELSYVAKALYRGKGYDDPLNLIEDKIGTRVVFLLSTDVINASKLVEDSPIWKAVKTKEYDAVHKKNPDAFGYQSIHIVVRPVDQSQYQNNINLITCEIQLRTLLQHAYSELSHDSTYKGAFKNDLEIKRRLSKSMALMEATDDYFCEVNKMIGDESRIMRNFTNELIEIYKTFNKDFVIESLDRRVLELFYELFEKLGHTYDITEVEKHFTNEIYKNKLIHVIKESSSYLTLQPAIVLIAFLVEQHRSSLRKYWPLDSFMLDKTFIDFGISTDN